MARRRRTYTSEFKAEAVKLVTEQGYSIAEAARSLGIGETLLRSWKQALQSQGADAFPGQGKLPAIEECQGTRTITRLGDTNRYEVNRLLRTIRSRIVPFTHLPDRDNPPSFSVAGLRRLPGATTALAPRPRRATLLMPGQTEAGSAGVQPAKG